MLIVALLLLLTLFSCRPPAPAPEAGAELTLLFTGDVLLDRGVRPLAESEGVEALFDSVSPLFREADAVVVNLECPLTDTLSPVHKKYIFRADSRWATGLRHAGITHAAMANNHTNDQGRRGLQSTHHHLLRAGITPLGYGLGIDQQLTPALVSKSGIDVALFNATTLAIENWCRVEGKPGICQPTADELVSTVSRYKAVHPHHRVVVILHWGTEFQATPNIPQRSLAHRLAKAGADAIVGHHPHVLQPLEYIPKEQKTTPSNDVPVFYSLGNFLFDQTPPITRRSAIASLRFHADGTLTADTIPILLEGCRPRTR